jgi:hypothetical protein
MNKKNLSGALAAPVLTEEQAVFGSESLAESQDWIVTPGGRRPRSLVHVVEPGHAIRFEDSRIHKVDLATNRHVEIGEFTASAHPAEAPAAAANWITYAFWNNDTGNPVTSFATTWTVPPAPGSLVKPFIFSTASRTAWVFCNPY